MKKIYYKNTLPLKKVKLTNFKGVSLDWYSKSLPVDYAIKQENLRALNGALIASKSLKNLDISFDDKIIKVIPFYDEIVKLLVVCSGKCFVLSYLDGKILRHEMSIDFAINDYATYKYGEENYLVLATDKGLKKFENGEFVNSELDIQFEIICNHFYRIFATEHQSTKLQFSDDFAPFNWTQSIDEGGYINLPYEKGKITDLVSFNQNLIVCQEDGITKITAYSEQDEFVVKSINSPMHIKTGSVADCGDYIMYATNKGLGIFDGYNCNIICEGLSGFLKDSEVTSAVAGDYCYFLCVNKNDSYIIAFNLAYKDYHFITCEGAKSIEKVKFNGEEYLLVICDNQIYMLSDESNSNTKVWQTGSLDFGSPAEYKLLKRIVLGGETIVDLKIAVDGKNYFFNIANDRSILLNLKGKQFEFEIVPKGRNINVPSPVLEYQVLEEN